MNDNKNTNTALANRIIGGVLAPADLDALDQIVTKLGQRRDSGSLDQASKEAAVKIIQDWDSAVTARIQANAQMARSVLDFLEGQPMNGSALDECVNLFHDAIGDTIGWFRYQEALDQYRQVQQDKPIDVPADPSMTVQEEDKLSLDNRAARLAWSRHEAAATFKVNKAVKDYRTALYAMPEVQEAAAGMRAYARKASRMAAQCSEKAALARINIQVGDPETRELLRQLLDFAKKI